MGDENTKILLISASFEKISLVTATKDNPEGIKTTDNSHYPLGIGYLHSYLEKKGNTVRTLFLNNYSENDCFNIVKENLEEFTPDVVGFQVLTTNRVSTYRMIEYVNDKYSNVKQVIGGVHTTVMYEQLLKKYSFLTAVLGEGEITFSELVKAFARMGDISDIEGIAYNRGGEIIVNKRRGLIENLDQLPFPKHEIFFYAKRTTGNLLTARGCPFNCTFCCLDSFSMRRVRMRSVINVIEEIEWLRKKYPRTRDIWIHDDTFFIDNNRVIELCDEIVKRKIDLQFTCSGRVKPISKELVKALERANFKKVLLGLESGDERILKSCRKGITREDTINAFKLFANSKIKLTAFLIVGLPGETHETALNTANFVKQLQKIKYVYYQGMAILSIYPGTEVYNIARDGGMINDDYWLTDKPTPLYTLENSKDKLFELQDVILNHISLDRFFTRKGFKDQIDMIPSIIKYFFDNKVMIKNYIYKLLKKILPKSIFYKIKYWRNQLAKNL